MDSKKILDNHRKKAKKRKTIVSSISLDFETYSFIKTNNIDLSRFVRDCIKELINTRKGGKNEN